MKKRRMLWISGFFFLLLLIWIGAKTSRAGYESPEYQVVQSDGDFEIREYPAMTAVAAEMSDEGTRNSGFGRLFKYISGGNEKEQKIAMTTPVLVEREDGASDSAMMFVMPKQIADAGAPKPKGETLGVRTIASGQFAVLRFSGHKSEEKQKLALEQLRKLIEEAARKSTGPPIFAFYDPPWTPEFLRRNEVLLRLLPAK
jgi:hypothetical protein